MRNLFTNTTIIALSVLLGACAFSNNEPKITSQSTQQQPDSATLQYMPQGYTTNTEHPASSNTPPVLMYTPIQINHEQPKYWPTPSK